MVVVLAREHKLGGHGCVPSLPDEGVDILALDVVQRLDGVLDLPLVRLHIHDEHKGVVVLDLLHRALRRQREFDDSVLRHLRGLCVEIQQHPPKKPDTPS